MIAAGASPAEAIRSALPGGTRKLSDFAERHGFNLPNVSNCIHGRERQPRVRAAFAEELGVEREWLDELLDSQAEQTAAVA